MNTKVEVTMEITYRTAIEYDVSQDELEQIKQGNLPDRIREHIENEIESHPDSCDVETDWAAWDSDHVMELQGWSCE